MKTSAVQEQREKNRLARATSWSFGKNSTNPYCRIVSNARRLTRLRSGDLTHQERLDYVDAVLCLQRLPSRTPANVSSGARSRVSRCFLLWGGRCANLTTRLQYDDFVVTHIQQTLEIHYTGNFLPWHRWFTWSYENALRSECGYKGYQPVRFRLLSDHRVSTRPRLKLINTPVLGLAKIRLRASRLPHLRRQRNKSRRQRREHPPRRPRHRGTRQRPTPRPPSRSRRRLRANRSFCKHDREPRTRVRNQRNNTRS